VAKAIIQFDMDAEDRSADQLARLVKATLEWRLDVRNVRVSIDPGDCDKQYVLKDAPECGHACSCSTCGGERV
jgi:hypothetical protein